MSCAPTPCPPGTVPSPEVNPTWVKPTDYSCFGGIYYNIEQIYVDTCPFGSPTPEITVVIPANTFSSQVSQEEADDSALEAAILEAGILRAATPCQAPPTPGDGFLLTEGVDFLSTEVDGDLILF